MGNEQRPIKDRVQEWLNPREQQKYCEAMEAIRSLYESKVEGYALSLSEFHGIVFDLHDVFAKYDLARLLTSLMSWTGVRCRECGAKILRRRSIFSAGEIRNSLVKGPEQEKVPECVKTLAHTHCPALLTLSKSTTRCANVSLKATDLLFLQGLGQNTTIFESDCQFLIDKGISQQDVRCKDLSFEERPPFLDLYLFMGSRKQPCALYCSDKCQRRAQDRRANMKKKLKG